jgi:predicted nucleic-acid-binding Zn-ribbon protein
MSLSTCPKCQSHNFEVKNVKPEKSVYELMFIQCSSCGCVVGVLEKENINANLKEVKDKLKIY